MRLFLGFALFLTSVAWAEVKLEYWKVQRKGANFFNRVPTEDWFIAAKGVGIQFARLACDKWQGAGRDFLLGNADAFKEISEVDFETLRGVLDQAQKHDIKVVITLLSLPGSRWRQNNDGQDDLQIWEDEDYQRQSVDFWIEFAKRLKDHPAVIGYNLLNEPHPERLASLNLFYEKIVPAIRQVDSDTPIIVDTGLYAAPWAIGYLNPIDEKGILYSFHMYDPYAYTTRKINNEKYQYPGTFGEGDLREFLEPVSAWQQKFQIPSSQILVGEFGCDRTSIGAEKYLGDLIRIFDDRGWHWAFYAFREDCWGGMDYELGSEKLPWEDWEDFRHDNPLFDVIKKGLLGRMLFTHSLLQCSLPIY